MEPWFTYICVCVSVCLYLCVCNILKWLHTQCDLDACAILLFINKWIVWVFFFPFSGNACEHWTQNKFFTDFHLQKKLKVDGGKPDRVGFIRSWSWTSNNAQRICFAEALWKTEQLTSPNFFPKHRFKHTIYGNVLLLVIMDSCLL